MPEAVIVDAVRTPIGRAFKGSLAHGARTRWAPSRWTRCSSATPEVDPELIEEVYCGVGLPQGLQGFNLGRIIALLSEYAGHQRHHRLALLRVEPRVDPPAANAVRADEATPTSPPAWNGSRATTRPSRSAALRTRTRGSRARTATPTPTSRWARPPRTGRALRGEPRRHGQVRPALRSWPCSPRRTATSRSARSCP